MKIIGGLLFAFLVLVSVIPASGKAIDYCKKETCSHSKNSGRSPANSCNYFLACFCCMSPYTFPARPIHAPDSRDWNYEPAGQPAVLAGYPIPNWHPPESS